MYLLNYYPGIDTEVRDCRGFTALIKAAMTGRTDVMAALVMAGMSDQEQSYELTDVLNDLIC